MLVEFQVKNFLSFQDLATLSMVAAKPFKEHESSHVIKTYYSFDLLKSAIVYGNNASGKSNLIKSIQFMKSTVLNSLRYALEDNFHLPKFALNTKSESEPSYFEVSFIIESKKYRYGYEIDSDKIVAEWLFHSTNKEVYLFKRDLQKIEINKSSFKEGIGKEVDVKSNVLFLSLLASFGKDISTGVIDWFKNLKLINGMTDYGFKRYTIKKLKSDKQFLNWVIDFTKYLEISNLSTSTELNDTDDLEFFKEKLQEEEFKSTLNTLHEIEEQYSKQDKLVTYHRKYDENNAFVEVVKFRVDNQESEGTKKLLYLLGPWYDALINNRILIIDELDSRLHNHLTRTLISFFHHHNKRSAQLICTVHDILLLDNDLFRRDQIWFIDKNQFGASNLYSLAEFKTNTVRKSSAFHKNYSEGKYGAVPYFENLEKLGELLDVEER